MKKKVLALLLCAVICISSIPSIVSASVDAGSEPEETITVIVADEDEEDQAEAAVPVEVTYTETEIESTEDAGDEETGEDAEAEIEIEVTETDIETADVTGEESSEDTINNEEINSEEPEENEIMVLSDGIVEFDEIDYYDDDSQNDTEITVAEKFKKDIESATNGETVTLGENIVVDCSEGDFVTITTPGITVDLGGYTITVSGDSSSYYVFDIVCGGAFTLQNGTIDGKTDVNVIDDEEYVNAAVTPFQSAAASNDVTLSNVTIQNFGSVSNGAVHATAGDLTVINCTILNNQTHGIYTDGCNNITITNSSISGNTSSSNGGGIYIWNEHGDLCIKKNTISNNTARYGGGIYVFESSDGDGSGEFAITGNTITNNKASEDGGGIYFEAPSATAKEGVGDYDLSGNTITYNEAKYYGGGIELFVNVTGREIVIKSGYIANNSAYWGGGIDSSYGFCQSVLHLYNAIITGNVAGFRGGGIWACPTSETTMDVTFGAAIYGNTATGKVSLSDKGASGNSIRFEGKDTDAADASNAGGYAQVSERALGGTLMDWFADDWEGNRYVEGASTVDVTSERYTGMVDSFGLYGELSAEGITLAKEDALLYIVNNTSTTVGGGIATNTAIEFGSDDAAASLTVTANKVWLDEAGNEISEDEVADYSVGITLVRIDKDRNEEKELETVILNADNGWTYDFEDLPTSYMTCDYNEETGEFIYNEHEYTYTAKEAGTVVEGSYTVEVESSPVTVNVETGNSEQTLTVTNTKDAELSILKEVDGDNAPESFDFEISISKDGEAYNGDITITDAEGGSSILAFAEGKAVVTLKAGEIVTLMIPAGSDCYVTEVNNDADTVAIYDSEGNLVGYRAEGEVNQATAYVGMIHESTQLTFVNSYRSYFPIDEEIVTDTDDIWNRSAWVKDEAVNEYNAIEIEMTTNLPVVTGYDLANGEFTMNFHEVLDHELVLDEDTADFTVYIAGFSISPMYYSITFDDDTGDDCNFHVDVDLTALYNDGIVTDDMLDGNTEITIFFFADLEGTGLNGSYTSTIWYDIYDGDELLYTSNESVVAVYTYEIEILKYDASTFDGEDYEDSVLAGATFGVYYDEDCSEPVIRNGEPYEVTSGEDGMVIFYGLADGTYYVKEIEAPEGYVLRDEVLEAVLGEYLNDSGYAYSTEFANTPDIPEGGEPAGIVPVSDGNVPESTVNEPGNSSATGDDSSLMLWLMMLCVSAFGIAGIMAVSFRKTKKSRR